MPKEKEKVRVFLQQQELRYDKDIDFTVYAEYDGEVVGTVSVAGDIIKAMAVDDRFRGWNLSGQLMDRVLEYLRGQRIYYYRVFTKPKNRDIFESLNFKEIVCTDTVLLMENDSVEGIRDCLANLRASVTLPLRDVGAIVMNCNPMTNGHKYLIEYAAARHETLLVFVVEEDLSVYPFRDRFRLVKEVTAGIQNVCVLPSTRYVISRLTFPTYFLKETCKESEEYAKVDAAVFKKYFMPCFSVSKRYVGTEPTDLATAEYNECLKRELKDALVEVERLRTDGTVVSASRVRQLASEKNWAELEKFVPFQTLEYLKNNGNFK